MIVTLEIAQWQWDELQRRAQADGVSPESVARTAIAWHLCMYGAEEEKEAARDAIRGTEDDPIMQLGRPGEESARLTAQSTTSTICTGRRSEAPMGV